MLELMGKEFVAICRYLEKTNCEKQKGFFIIKKTDLEKLLKQNNYELAARKLHVWKKLRWIDADADKLTRKVYDKDAKTYMRKVRIEIAMYEQLNELMREKYHPAEVTRNQEKAQGENSKNNM